MMTRFAFLASTSEMTWFRPDLMKYGFFDSSSSFLPAARSAARWSRRAFFSCFVSPLYFCARRKNAVAVFLSRTLANWAIAGGVLRRW